jgi:predicted TIM-barrel fold metal-dependent hydrolase
MRNNQTSSPDKEKQDLPRRNFFYSTLASIAGIAGMAGLSSRAEAEVNDPKRGRVFKVMDFRCRPPLESFSGLFDMRQGYIARRPTVLANPATHGKVPEVVRMVGKPGAMKAWWAEIDKAGIDKVVVAGRITEDPNNTMDGAALLKMEKEYSGRFYGITPVNLEIDMKQALANLEKELVAGIRGATIEPGYRQKGGPTTMDNAEFFPLYELLQDRGIPLQVQTGAFAGVDNWDQPNQIWRMDSVMKKFPKLQLILGHGGYPRITEALALALKWPSVVISSDVYTFWPGGQLYQQNIEMLQDQFVYGSAFPFGNFDTTLEQTLALPLSDAVMQKYLYDNAARLLKLS